MTKNFDYVILSTTNHPDYIGYWPHVSYAWKRLFDVDAILAFVARSEDEYLFDDLRQHGEVIMYRAVEGVPIANQGKVSRLFTAARQGSSVCVINDIDLIPLQSKYLNDLLACRPKNHVLCVGGDAYNGTPDEGKFPMGYLTAEGDIFKEIVNPSDQTFEDFIRSFVGISVFDHKEDISITIPPGHADTFSDESLFRMLLKRWGKKSTINVPRGWSKYSDRAACRAEWSKIDFNKLKDGTYVECHAPHPFNAEMIEKFMEHLICDGS